MIRIKYTKIDNILWSRDFLTKKDTVIIKLLPNKFLGEISGSKTYVSFMAKNLRALKTRAKQELTALGVIFEEEVRPRLKRRK